MPPYDQVSHSVSTQSCRIEPAEVVVIDGTVALVDPTVGTQCDAKVFLEVDADIRIIRRIGRDMALRCRSLYSELDQYLTTVRPMHLQFVEPGKRRVDAIVLRGESNTAAIEVIVAPIQRCLQQRAVKRAYSI